MCLLLVGWKADESFPLVLAANRDEMYERPTTPAAWWNDHPEILAGRDLRAGGTWLGLTAAGRFAALTNYREPGRHQENTRSRGDLVRDFLQSEAPPEQFAEVVAAEGSGYNGFNLVFGDVMGELFYASNRSNDPPREVGAGVHGLSNHLLDTPWPKVLRGKSALQAMLESPAGPQPEALFALLEERTVPQDRELPDTGVGLELERLLAPLFIETAVYGTRCSTVLLMHRSGQVRFVERTFGPGHVVLGTRAHELAIRTWRETTEGRPSTGSGRTGASEPPAVHAAD